MNEDDRTRASVNGPPIPGDLTPAMAADWRKALLWGVLSGWVLIFLPYIIILAWQNGGFAFLFVGSGMWVYNASILLLMPVIQGLFGGLKFTPGPRSGASIFGLICAIWAIDIVMAIVFLREGAICLIMAGPLLWLMEATGYMVGRWLANMRRGTGVSVSLVPLVLLATVGETMGPVPNHAQVITDSVTVNAPADYVWKYVVDYPDNPNPPAYWMWTLGLPSPTHSVAPLQQIGARRECRFSGGQGYEERITELEPGKKLTFAVTRQMQHPEILGHVTFDQGQIVLHQNDDGTTTLTTTGWYRLHVRPASYFDWWAADVTRHIHVRVLGYMKSLAERDYRTASANRRKM